MTTSLETKRIFCAEFSQGAEEQLFGTAKPVDLWFFIEYRGRWEHKALSVLPESVQAYLSMLQTSYPKYRVALIRQTERTSGPLAVFVASTHESEPRLHRFEFQDHREITSLNIASLGDQCSKPNGKAADLSLIAVCTHGVHDLCCAKFGNATYEALKRRKGDDVWQVSHIGGCRFASNVVCLPHGIVYGRVQPADCDALVSTFEDRSLYLQCLRGRSCYSKPVQAAEYFVRTKLGIPQLDRLTVTYSEEISPERWKVTFRCNPELCRYQVIVAEEDAPAATYKSCASTTLTPRKEFRVLQFT